jgi:hypothetical protein
VQDGHDHLDRGLVLLLVQVDRDAAAIVFDPHRVVLADGDVDRVAVPGERFIHCVVDDFVDQVVETAGTG